jgi:hypothetical protein
MSDLNAPWDAESAKDFLTGFDAYKNVIRTIEKTLQKDAKVYPNEIRAAAAMVILLCRENLWPTKGGVERRDKVVHVAARQLTTIKHLFEQRGKTNPELLTNKNYRNLLMALDEEVRILEARLSDPKPQMPKETPSTWSQFWP